MKITLKRVILCGAMLLGAIFFLIALLVPMTLKSNISPSVSASMMGTVSGKPFNDFLMAEYLVVTTQGSMEGMKNYANVGNITFRVLTIMVLIFVIADLLAITGAFFLKTNGGARKLIIPFMAITIVMEFVVIVVFLGTLNPTYKGVRLSETSLAVQFVLYLLGLICFIGALIASGVTPEKVLVGKKD